jgi:hypothetical protein
MAVEASPELVRETLAALYDRAISMARAHRSGTIVLEKGLGNEQQEPLRQSAFELLG